MLMVVAAILERDGRVLIGQRRPGGSHALKWEFPGGKVEAGESPEEAIIRELREELGIEAAEVQEIHRYEYAYPGKRPLLLVFLRVPVFTGEPVNQAFARIAWAAPGDFRRYDFLDGDRDFLTWLAASNSSQTT
jgi:8-oxo-dGTP diphosphatase